MVIVTLGALGFELNSDRPEGQSEGGKANCICGLQENEPVN